MTRAVRQSCGNSIRFLDIYSIDLLLVLVVTFRRVIACFQFQTTNLSINKTCSYMVPHMLFKYKFQRRFSRESLEGCRLSNVNDITNVAYLRKISKKKWNVDSLMLSWTISRKSGTEYRWSLGVSVVEIGEIKQNRSNRFHEKTVLLFDRYLKAFTINKFDRKRCLEIWIVLLKFLCSCAINLLIFLLY